MRFRKMLLIATVVALAAAACSSGSDDAGSGGVSPPEPAPPPGETTTEVSPAEPTEAPPGDDVPPETAAVSESDTAPDTDTSADTVGDAPTADVHFVYANPYTFPDLDPSSAFSNENVLLQNVYETLTRLADPEASDEVSGLLAESWESNEDATVWTFKLRGGVTFHDGEPLTAAAVRDSLQRTIDLDLGAAFILLPIESMDVEDELTITFNLSYPAPLDVVMSSQYAVYIMSPNTVSQDAAWFNEGNAAGTGPWMIESYEPVGTTRLVRYDDYWGGWSDGQITTVDFRLVEDPVLAEQLVRNGDADYTYNLPFDVYASLDGLDGIEVHRGLSMTNLFGMLNTRRLSPAVREALVLSFPYDDVTGSLYGGEAVRAHGIIPLTVWGADPDLDLPETDLDRAQALLDAEGVTDLSVTYSFDAGTTEQQQIGEVWKANLATIGVDLVLEPLTWDARWEKAKSDPEGAQDVFTMFWFPTFVTPYDFLFSTFHSEEEPFFNLGYYSNETFDTLIDGADALSGVDREAAVAMFQEAQRILLDEHAAVFMLDVPAADVMSTGFTGYVQNPAYKDVVRFYDLRSAG